MSHRDERRGQAGFSLVEALVGLALLAMMLILSLGIFWRLPRDAERLAAEQQAVRALSATLEALHAGALPLASGEVDVEATTGTAPERGLALTLAVEPTTVPDLYAVELEARYFVLGETRRRHLSTRTWRP